jgi:hypothetical protein
MYVSKILALCSVYKGEKEISPNLGFQNNLKDSLGRVIDFAKKMVAVGFYRTASWCGFYVMCVLFDAYADNPTVLALLKKYCSASTHEMWTNFKASKEFKTGLIPRPGALVFWVEGNGTNGHVGICLTCDGTSSFTSSEGNSNTDGSRNGDEVAENHHTTNKPHSVNGLNYLGCVYMPE